VAARTHPAATAWATAGRPQGAGRWVTTRHSNASPDHATLLALSAARRCACALVQVLADIAGHRAQVT
jgi:hypothetical protein